MVGTHDLSDRDLVTVPELARILRIGRSTAYALVESGALPSYRVGSVGSRRGRLLVDRRDVASYLDGCRQGATRAPVRVDADQLLAKVRKGRGNGS